MLDNLGVLGAFIGFLRVRVEHLLGFPCLWGLRIMDLGLKVLGVPRCFIGNDVGFLHEDLLREQLENLRCLTLKPML